MAIKDIFLPIMVGIPAQLLLIFIKTGSWMFRPHAFDRGQGLVGLRPYALSCSLGSFRRNRCVRWCCLPRAYLSRW